MVFFLPSLQQSGQLRDLPMVVCSVGSRQVKANEDFASQGWSLFGENLTVYGFDADADACDAANAAIERNPQATWTEKHLPLVLSDTEGSATLYVTRNPMCSSLYPPNIEFLKQFSGLLDVMDVDFTLEVETTTLDRFCKAENANTVDFLQIDVQGADLKVLQGADRILETVLAVEVEVMFNSLYVGQPLFGEVDVYLRERGFSLFDLGRAHRERRVSPVKSTVRHTGQLLWGEGFYFRDLVALPEEDPLKTPQNLLKLACIADLLSFPEYCLELLVYLTERYGQETSYDCFEAIAVSLSQFPELVDRGLETLSVLQPLQHRFCNLPQV
ncbi:FkbM family methyltransferase [Baaleninema sp.]|uniref:FkbM family methyltransferase n=1 Tax=Baaleninema sp. TaxID=3101197 RepID=UPI003D06655B